MSQAEMLSEEQNKQTAAPPPRPTGRQLSTVSHISPVDFPELSAISSVHSLPQFCVRWRQQRLPGTQRQFHLTTVSYVE